MEALCFSVRLTSHSVFDSETLKAIDALIPEIFRLTTNLPERLHFQFLCMKYRMLDRPFSKTSSTAILTTLLSFATIENLTNQSICLSPDLFCLNTDLPSLTTSAELHCFFKEQKYKSDCV